MSNKMAIQIKVPLMNLENDLPSVKIVIDYLDIKKTISLQDKHLVISQDGSCVNLHKKIVEQLCRQEHNISSMRQIKIQYFNEQKENQEFPSELFICNLSSNKTPLPKINIGSFKMENESSLPKIQVTPNGPPQLVMNGSGISNKSGNERFKKKDFLIKVVVEDIHNQEGSELQQADDNDLDAQFFHPDPKRKRSARVTIVNQEEFCEIDQPQIAQQKQRAQAELDNNSASDSEGGLSNLLDDMNRECEEDEDDEESEQKQSSLETDSQIDDDKEQDEEMNLEDLDCLGDVLNDIEKNSPKSNSQSQSQKHDDDSQNAHEYESSQIKKANLLGQESRPTLETQRLARRPSMMQKREKTHLGEPGLNRGQSQMHGIKTQGTFFGSEPALQRIKSQSSTIHQSSFKESQKAYKEPLQQNLTLERRVEYLEFQNMQLQETVNQLCQFLRFQPQQAQNSGNQTITEVTDQSEYSGSVTNMSKHSKFIQKQYSSIGSSNLHNKMMLVQQPSSQSGMWHHSGFSSGRQHSYAALTHQQRQNSIPSFQHQNSRYNESHAFLKQDSALCSAPHQSIHQHSHSMPLGLIGPNSFEEQRPHIIFAYANAFGFQGSSSKKEFVSMSDRQIISPDVMFDSICRAVRSKKKKMTIHKRILNFQSFDDILSQGPHVLVIMCHGMLQTDKEGNEKCFFCFENQENPYLIDKYDEERLIGILKDRKINIDVIILSTCHSQRLGQRLVDVINPAPAVIAINTTDQIAQASTFKFNEKFIQCLISQQMTVRNAFDQAKALVASMPAAENKCCCCNHGHTPQCLFVETVKKEFKGDFDKACQQLHQDQCDCYTKLALAKNQNDLEIADENEDENDAQLYISHEHGCRDYATFFKTLTKGSKRTDKLLENQDAKGYLQRPLSTYQRGKYNLKCCCQSHVVHRESDKFMIVNEKNEIKLEKKDVFPTNLPEGQPEIIETNFDNIKGLNDNRRAYFPRKEEVYEILTFLKDKDKKILIVSGPKGVNKMRHVAKAIRYAREHDFDSVRDGAYHIDLSEVQSMTDFYQLLIDTLNLTIRKADQKSISHDTFLKTKSSTIVYSNLPFEKEEIFNLQGFIQKLQFDTELNQIIVIPEIKYKELRSELKKVPELNIEYMQKPVALELLKRILFIEHKTKFIKDIDLEKHKVFEIWEKINFVDDEAFSIVNVLSQRKSLTDIANAMEQSLCMNEMNQSNQQVDVKISLTSLSVSKTLDMISKKDKLLNDLIIFLTICPQGLCLTDIAIVLRLLATQESAETDEDKIKKQAEANEDKIKMYLGIMQEVSHKSKGNFAEISLEHNIQSSGENLEKREIIKDVVKSLLFFDTQEQPFSETIVKLQLKERPALEFIVRNNSQIEQDIANVSSMQLLKYALDFYMPYMKYLLFKIRDQRQSGFADHRFITASLLMGMWQQITAGPEFNDFIVIDSHFDARFHMHRQNLSNLLQKETLELLVPQLFLKSQSPDYYSLSDEDIAIITTLVNDLREISIVIPAILTRLDKQADAIASIELSRNLFNFEECTWTHGVLDLLEASTCIYSAYTDNNFDDLSKFTSKKLSAFSIFEQIDDNEGKGETYFLWAIAIIMKESSQTKKKKTGEFDFDTRREGTGESLTQENEFEQQEAFFDQQRVTSQSLYEMLPKIRNPTAIQCLDEALRLFDKAERIDKKICSFNMAKCLFEKAQALIDAHHRDPSMRIQSRQSYLESQKNAILDCIKGVKDKIKFVQKLNKQKGKPDQVNENYIKNFYARCNLVKAKMYEGVNDLPEALKFIQAAIENLDSTAIRTNYSIQKQQSESLISDTMSEFKSPTINQEKVTECLNQDSQLRKQLMSIKSLIMIKFRLNVNNLLTFAKATPLVDKNSTGIFPISDATRSDFDMKTRMINALEDTKKQFKVKFDILSKRFLQEIAKDGTRLLHITSDISKEDVLCVEGAYGYCNELPLDKLCQILGGRDKNTPLNTEVVGIALPNSLKLGQVFKKLQVKHVLCFDRVQHQVENHATDQLENELNQYRFNYIYNFCEQFYTEIANEETVIDSYLKAQQWIQDDQNQFEYIWDGKDPNYDIQDLNIRAMLIDEESEQHQVKLFDSTQDENQTLCLSKGSVIDTSRPRGELIGFKKNKNSYFGQKVELHTVVEALSRSKNPQTLVHVRGQEHVGKTRFVQEVCYYFFCHNKFRYIIMFKDLSKIENHQQFKDLMELLNQQIEEKQSSDHMSMSQSMDNDSQNEDELNDNKGSKHPQPDILWAFTNVDKMKKDFWSRLESRLLDIHKSHSRIRYIMTSIEHGSKLFTCFKNEEEGYAIDQFRRSSTSVKVNQNASRVDVRLMPLQVHEVTDLVLYQSKREITFEDFGFDEESTQTPIRRLIELEKCIEDCKGLPYWLKQVTDLLSKNVPLYKVAVEKPEDYLKGTQAHSKAKRKEMYVHVKKDKSEAQTVSLHDMSIKHASSIKLSKQSKKVTKNNKGNNSNKADVTGKLSKNQRRKLKNPHCNEEEILETGETSDALSEWSIIDASGSGWNQDLLNQNRSAVVLTRSKKTDMVAEKGEHKYVELRQDETNYLEMSPNIMMQKQRSEMPANIPHFNEMMPIKNDPDTVHENLSSSSQMKRNDPPTVVLSIKLNKSQMSKTDEKSLDAELLDLDSGPEESKRPASLRESTASSGSKRKLQKHKSSSSGGNHEESKISNDQDSSSQIESDSQSDNEDYMRSQSDSFNTKTQDESILAGQPLILRSTQSERVTPVQALNEPRRDNGKASMKNSQKSRANVLARPIKKGGAKTKTTERKHEKFNKKTKNKYRKPDMDTIQEDANQEDSDEQVKSTKNEQQAQQKQPKQQQKKSGKNSKKKDSWEDAIDAKDSQKADPSNSQADDENDK